jgi:hypothetical protein
MSRCARSIAIASALAGAWLAAMSTIASAADTKIEDDDTRAVRIIEAPEPQATAPAAPPAAMPGAPAAAPMPPHAATPPPATTPVLPTAPPLEYPAQRKQVTLGAIPTNSKIVNTAELSLELLPGLDVAVGTKVSFRVTTKKAGYLILVDVDANGNLTQIYPYPGKMTADRPVPPDFNYIRPGKPLQIPPPGGKASGVEYVASPPSGVAMIVAILSDRPVQIVDLPDIPTSLTGQAEALAFLTKFAKELRIPQPNSGRLQEAHWSFDAKFYAIR